LSDSVLALAERKLTAAEFDQLTTVPAEAEWFANLEQATCVQYLCRSLAR
jgi:hypothetical protein